MGQMHAAQVQMHVAAPVEEHLTQVAVGSTLNFEGQDLGDQAGQVMLVVDKLSLGMQVNEWTAGKVTATLPLMGLAGATKAEIILVKADGQIASSIKVELIPAASTIKIALPKEV